MQWARIVCGILSPKVFIVMVGFSDLLNNYSNIAYDAKKVGRKGSGRGGVD